MQQRSAILARIVRYFDSDHSGADVIEKLTRLAPTDLQSLLLHVFQQRSAARTPAQLLAHYMRTPMCQPATADARLLSELEHAAFDSAADFAKVLLAPVMPVGVNAVLGEIDQNNCLASIRHTEVLADATTALALECARRRQGDDSLLKLCATSRQLRLQPLGNTVGFSPHFALFALVSAGRDTGSSMFELQQLQAHLEVYLRLLHRLNEQHCQFDDITVSISDTRGNEPLLTRVQTEMFGALSKRFPLVTFRIDRQRTQGARYYHGLCLNLSATAPDGSVFNIGDGGCTDWTQRLLSNAKERLLVSGVGIELISKLFRRPA